MSLADMLKDPAVGIDRISEWLDGLTDAQRVEAAFSLDRAGQRTLYRHAAARPPVALEHFVPAGVAPGVAVHHRGRNSLPLPPKLKLFEKRFCRAQDGSARLFGYNESPFLPIIGPGFFVARPSGDDPAWQERGAVVVDYFQVPDGAVAPGWPPVIPNSQGLQRFVYHGTRDFMRGVSQQVSIGAAYKGEKPLDHYFILVRRD